MPYYPTRKLTVFALDPSVKDQRGRILRTVIDIPNETLSDGPRGHRVHVIDYDSTNDAVYGPAAIGEGMNCDAELPPDPFAKASDKQLLGDQRFHAFMTYAVIMRTLARFEYALGRRLSWSFDGPQIQVAPHAFSDANAFYSDTAQGLYFGYFPSADGKRKVFSCLSYEVVAHETTHALLDGLRSRYTDPSSPQQAGFHEGFADIVALLSILSNSELVARVVDLGVPGNTAEKIDRKNVSVEKLRDSGLFGLAQEMGSELASVHGQALRRSVTLAPRRDYLGAGGDHDEPHSCGEVLVAAVLNAYLDVWVERLKAIGDKSHLDRKRASEEGADVADRMLTMFIRAIDYCPPTDLQFGDFASAVLTSDWELNPLDDRYRIRRVLRKWFRAYGIDPRAAGTKEEPGVWDPPPSDCKFNYDRTHFDQMKSDPDEVFRFIWENRKAFRLHEEAFTRVLSVRPCTRFGRDGFLLRETVVEYHQQLTIFARELARLKIVKPDGMPDDTQVTIFGGNSVIFDEYGHVKYNVGNSLLNSDNQSRRLQYLWEQGAFNGGDRKMRAFSRMHVRRGTDWYRSVQVPAEPAKRRKP